MYAVRGARPKWLSLNMSRNPVMMIKNIVVLGTQWGDEGKGKLVDILSANYDICARVAGGSNAGHTIVVEVSYVDEY